MLEQNKLKVDENKSSILHLKWYAYTIQVVVPSTKKCKFSREMSASQDKIDFRNLTTASNQISEQEN